MMLEDKYDVIILVLRKPKMANIVISFILTFKVKTWNIYGFWCSSLSEAGI